MTGWVTFLSALAIVLFAVAGFRWLRSQLLWRLRNRLIVTYVFIGVIPVFLLVVISLITLYLLAGQFASFVVTSDIATHLRSMEAANRAIAHQLATQISERWEAGCGNPRPGKAASSGVVAAAGVRVVSEPAAALLLGAGRRGGL